MFNLKTFPNGLRLLTAPVGGTKAVTVLVLVGAGSRYESDRERGIAHFLEHMFFKGGKRYDTPRKVSETIDGIGGDFNAFTGKEYAGYYVKCASDQKEIAFDVLGDMLQNTKLDPADIERERGVIIEELNMYQDTPMYQIGWDFENLLFGDTPMGRDQIGLPETIRSFSGDDFRAYRRDLYTPDNTVVIVAGDVETDEAALLAEKYFHDESLIKQRVSERFGAFDESRTVLIREKKTEQAHLVIGYPGVPFRHRDELAVRLLSIILGGNMSSRMFLGVREEKGLCYSISTSTDHYSDVGVLSTHAGVDLNRTAEAISAIAEQYRLMREHGPTEAEVYSAKNFLKGKLTLRMEDSEELAGFLGVQSILIGDDIVPIDELFRRIDMTDTGDITRVAHDLLSPGLCRLAVIGPFLGRDHEFASYVY